jgi:hypothetical protein
MNQAYNKEIKEYGVCQGESFFAVCYLLSTLKPETDTARKQMSTQLHATAHYKEINSRTTSQSRSQEETHKRTKN